MRIQKNYFWRSFWQLKNRVHFLSFPLFMHVVFRKEELLQITTTKKICNIKILRLKENKHGAISLKTQEEDFI